MAIASGTAVQLFRPLNRRVGNPAIRTKSRRKNGTGSDLVKKAIVAPSISSLVCTFFSNNSGQWFAQLLGVATLLGFGLTLTYGLNWLLNRVYPQRVAMEGERQGMDLHELGASAYPEFITHTEEFMQGLNSFKPHFHWHRDCRVIGPPLPVDPTVETGIEQC